MVSNLILSGENQAQNSLYTFTEKVLPITSIRYT